MHMVLIIIIKARGVHDLHMIQGGTTPLMAASWFDHVETADLLLSSGADVNQTNVSDFIHVV